MEKNGSASSKDERTFSFDGIVRFSERLRIAMKGISNHALARKSGLSEASIRKYVKGDSYPTIDNAAKVADACGVSLTWLLTGQECILNGEHEHLPNDIANNSTQNSVSTHITNNDAQNGLQIMIASLPPEDTQALFLTLCQIGINGVLERLRATNEEHRTPEADLESVIRSLNTRESFKEAMCMALAGDEETDREILRGIESRNRARAPGDSASVTPEQETKPVDKKSA